MAVSPRAAASSSRPGQGPRQGGLVDLARGAGGQVVEHREQGDERRRQLLGEAGPGGGLVEGVGHGEVADEHLVARLGRSHGGRGGIHAGQLKQRGLDLTEFDAAAADLHLVVGTALEQQSDTVEDHEVARAVGTLPAEGRHRRVLLRVLLGVEVAREPDAADDELARLAVGDRVTLGIDHGERPAVERQADAHRAVGVHERGARDDRGLGRPVGVPHLALGRGEPRGELGRHGLAAEDQQPHVLDGLGRPERGEGRHRRDHRDGVRDHPRAEVHAAAHEASRRGHEARAVPPREPHLLAGGVERHREPGQHAVARPERLALQEQPRLGVDERRGRTVRHRDALGCAGRARGEDDPRVVIELGRAGDGRRMCARVRRFAVEQLGRRAIREPGTRAELAASGDDAAHCGLAEDEPRALFGVVGIDGHVRSTCGHRPEDRDVQLTRTRRHANAHAIAAPHARPVQPGGRAHDARHELAVAERAVCVLEGRGVGMPLRRVAQHVEQGARRGRLARSIEDSGGVSGHATSCWERSTDREPPWRCRVVECVKCQSRRKTISCALVNRE